MRRGVVLGGPLPFAFLRGIVGGRWTRKCVEQSQSGDAYAYAYVYVAVALVGRAAEQNDSRLSLFW